MADKEAAKPVTSISLMAAWLSIAAIIAYQLMLVALILIRRDLDPSWHTISEWAIGRHGWIMSLAFLVSAVSYGSLFLTIKSQMSNALGKTGLVLLFICFVGTVGVGLFTTDPYPPEKHLTTRGIVHIVSGTSAMLLLPFAALLINLSLARKNEEWFRARGPLLLTAGLPLVAFIGFVAHLIIFVFPMGDYYGPGLQIGYPPRILFLTYLVWLITLAWQAIRVRGQQSQ